MPGVHSRARLPERPPRAEVRILEHSGHRPFVDDPAVEAALLGHLARHATVRTPAHTRQAA